LQGAHGTFAAKIFDLKHPSSDEIITSFQSELDILKKFKHPSIISLIGFKRTSTELILVLELCDATLGQMIREKSVGWFPGSELTEMCIKILQGLRYLHINRIAHLDIKVNLFVTFFSVHKIE
jgi:serine/threonine protein kinase